MFCNRQDRNRIKRRASIVCPDYTGPVALLLVALIAMGMILWAGVSARAEGQTMYVCTETDPLNVRDAPDIHSDWVFRLDRGEPVTVLEIKNGWAYVSRCGDYGWAWAEYLADTPPVDKLPEGWLDVEED